MHTRLSDRGSSPTQQQRQHLYKQNIGNNHVIRIPHIRMMSETEIFENTIYPGAQAPSCPCANVALEYEQLRLLDIYSRIMNYGFQEHISGAAPLLQNPSFEK